MLEDIREVACIYFGVKIPKGGDKKMDENEALCKFQIEITMEHINRF